MKEVRYMISDTAKKVDVEAHVLRYWEDELELVIGRTEMGHRYYTPDDIVLFKNIKELKERGFQLKAIKMLLPELRKNKGEGIEKLLLLREELNEKAGYVEGEVLPAKDKPNPSPSVEKQTSVAVPDTYPQVSKPALQEEKILQFQEILKDAVLGALQENNEELQREMGRQVSDHVIKEVDYIMRMQDEREEERFKQLDETIRNYQKSRQEVAISKREEKKESRFRRKKAKKEKQK